MSTYEFVVTLSAPGTIPFFLLTLGRVLFPEYAVTLFKLSGICIIYVLLWGICASAYGIWWVANHLCY